ncbi:hypothetical protein [Sphingobacterium mizutaii]|uniref:hypothetical protein n=1 Tax=Sphingobacterium mizutaii TaxID=1010 RepID=UPI00162ACDFC|nr:hypothetical protein [Sphingobacterium mizutaii]
MSKRFCTTIMKMQAIFDLLLTYFELPVKMRIVGTKWKGLKGSLKHGSIQPIVSIGKSRILGFTDGRK